MPPAIALISESQSVAVGLQLAHRIIVRVLGRTNLDVSLRSPPSGSPPAALRKW